MLRGVWVPCWRDVAGLAAGADSVSLLAGVVSWLLCGVCGTAGHGEAGAHTHTRSLAVGLCVCSDRARAGPRCVPLSQAESRLRNPRSCS